MSLSHGIIFEYDDQLLQKPVAILLLLLHTAVNTEAGQVLRMPALLKHFKQHHTTNPSISFGQFLVMHYTGTEKNDDKTHDQLPFHNFDHASVNNLFSPMVMELPLFAIPVEQRTGFLISDFLRPPAGAFSRILQPPRFHA